MRLGELDARCQAFRIGEEGSEGMGGIGFRAVEYLCGGIEGIPGRPCCGVDQRGHDGDGRRCDCDVVVDGGDGFEVAWPAGK